MSTVVKEWFREEVLPLEAALTRYLARNWVNRSEIADLRQDVYEKAIRGAGSGLPDHTAAYIFAIARNHLISLSRRGRVVAFEGLPTEEGAAQADLLTPERHATGQDELRRLQVALDSLPKGCQEVVRLRKVEGLTSREVAVRLGSGIDAVEQQTKRGMRALADLLYSPVEPEVRTTLSLMDRKRHRR